MALRREWLTSAGLSLQQLEAGLQSPARDEVGLQQSERCTVAARPSVSERPSPFGLQKKIPTKKVVSKYLFGGKCVQYMWTGTRADSESHALVTV